jgi:hypothetical protein
VLVATRSKESGCPAGEGETMTIARTMLIAGTIAFLPSAATILSPGQAAAQVQTAVTVDPPRDAAHPPAMTALVIPSGDGAMNALLYTAAGAGPHPTLVFFHGFPGTSRTSISPKPRGAQGGTC